MKTTRHIGNCQVCEGDQKLHEGRMVHHGYKRPGDGEIHGDCPGVGHVPYEVSCDLVKSYRKGLEARLPHQEKRLADITAGRVTHFSKIRLGRRLENENFAVGVTEPYRFKQALESLRWDAEGGIRSTRSEIERSSRRIAAWTPKPVRTVEEEQQKADGLRAERKAAKDAARAARDAKKAATAAKQADLEAHRAAVRANFDAQFQALVVGPGPLAERRAAAIQLLQETRKSKFSWLALYELRCEEALRALGLCTLEGVNGFGRPCVRWTDEVVAAMGWRRPA